MKTILVIFFILIFSFCGAQRFKSLSPNEKRWSFVHPFAALKVRKLYKKCYPIYESVSKNNELDNFSSGGKLDAYRHVFFMAAFSQKIKTKKIRKLGVAHEKGNYLMFLKNKKENDEVPDSLSSVMDLFNNETGIRIGVENKNAGLKELSLLVLSEIKKGGALYFKRNEKGEYMNCFDKVLRLEDFSRRWYVPKCLITTDK